MPEEDQSETMDFGALLNAHMNKVKSDFSVGDKVRGTVTEVGGNSIFVDIGARSDGIIDINEFRDADGELTIQPGDPVEAFYIGSLEGSIRLTTRMSGNVADASIREAYEAGIPVEGRVVSERKGGFEVKIANQSAFCPFSQIDIFKRDSEAYLGERFSFLIIEYSSEGRNIVVSRRSHLAKEQAKQKEKLTEELAEDTLVQGRVTRIAPFGVFVDLGGVEGLIHVSELGWGRGLKPEDVLSEGDDVEVTVKQIDWDRDRISLSLKHAEGDPWTKLAEKPDFHTGGRYKGTVSKIMPFGAFVELEPGLEGLVHISKMGAGRRINSPAEVVSEEEQIEVSIEKIDLENRRISLSMDDTIGGEISLGERDQSGAPGSPLKGIVDGIKDFGVFVRLPNGKTGLLHVSQIELTGSGNRLRELHRTFPPGSEVEVVIREIKGDRISLTLPETLAREAEQASIQEMTDEGSADLGSLNDLFNGMEL